MNNCLLLITSLVVSGFLSAKPVWGQATNSAPMFESTTLRPNFQPDPQRLRGVSGGAIQARDRAIANRTESPTGPCAGYVDIEPDHTLILSQYFDYLRLSVSSPADTTLIVKGPGGSWCNDDAGGSKNPAIAGQWQQGRYSIWVGSYDKDEYHPYVIQITQED